MGIRIFFTTHVIKKSHQLSVEVHVGLNIIYAVYRVVIINHLISYSFNNDGVNYYYRIIRTPKANQYPQQMRHSLLICMKFLLKTCMQPP